MKTEAEIKARLEHVHTLAHTTAEVVKHGLPSDLTIYKEALEWVLRDWSHEKDEN